MKDMVITNEIRMEVIKYFGYENNEDLKNDYLNEVPDDLFKFYYHCMKNGMDVCDADEYAVLNTLFDCDIGVDNAREINRWLWENKDVSVMELNADNSKELLEEVVKELNLDIKFDKFITENFIEYKYFIEQ